MTRNILVRVFDSEGRPQKHLKVSCFIYQILANGTKVAWTNEEGEAQFDLDVDEGAEIELSVDKGRRQVRRGPIRGSYRIEI